MSVSKAHLSDPLLVKRAVALYVSERKPTLREVGEELRLSYHTVVEMVRRELSPEQRAYEKQLRYSRGKLGALNPMKGRTRELHPNYKGNISDGKGYLLVLRPGWFTSRPGSKHVFLHHVVFCESSGLTGIPVGFTVHHIDGNPKNNEIDNLALVTMRGHARIHYPKSEKFSTWEKHLSGTLKSKKTIAT